MEVSYKSERWFMWCYTKIRQMVHNSDRHTHFRDTRNLSRLTKWSPSSSSGFRVYGPFPRLKTDRPISSLVFQLPFFCYPKLKCSAGKVLTISQWFLNSNLYLLQWFLPTAPQLLNAVNIFLGLSNFIYWPHSLSMSQYSKERPYEATEFCKHFTEEGSFLWLRQLLEMTNKEYFNSRFSWRLLGCDIV